MDSRTRHAVTLMYEAAVEARRLHDTQAQHLDRLVAVASALHDLALAEDERPLRVVGGGAA